MPKIHVIIPCFNEAPTLSLCLDRILKVEWPGEWESEIIIVDDSSVDDTRRIAHDLSNEERCITLLLHDQNRGKGSAVRTGLHHALLSANEDDLLVIQDADLEYHPTDLVEAIARFRGSELDAIIGDRFDVWTKPSEMGAFHMSVNRLLTMTSNLMTGLELADMECCYKVMRTSVVRRILPELNEERFGIEPQIAASLARTGMCVGNMPVEYEPRTTAEGKKIGIADGVRALYVIFREWLMGKPSNE